MAQSAIVISRSGGLGSNVTFDEIQLSATSRVVGRITAGAGAAEELTGANVRTIAGLATTDSPTFLALNLTSLLTFSAATTITGGAGNMTIVAGTGNSRTLTLQSTTSGGTATNALVINATQDVSIPSATASSSTTTGALVVVGGIGVAGAVNVGAGATLGGTLSAYRWATDTAPRTTAAWGTTGVINVTATKTATDSSTAGSGTAAIAVFSSFAVPTLAATNASVTTTDAANLYVAGAVTAGTNMTITNPWSLWVDAGATRLDGTLRVCGDTATPAAGSTSARMVFGTTAGFGVYYGSGAPTVSAAQGSLYLRSDGSGIADRLYVNTTGSTTWTNFVSAA